MEASHVLLGLAGTRVTQACGSIWKNLKFNYRKAQSLDTLADRQRRDLKASDMETAQRRHV